MSDEPRSSHRQCANCGTTLTGPFCSECGQHVADSHRSLRKLLSAFFGEAFSWDSKLFRTLGPLIKRPGFLTQEYMAGRRMRYVQPLRLFLFASAVCLTIVHLSNITILEFHSNKTPEKSGVNVHFHLNSRDKKEAASNDDQNKSSEHQGAAAVPTPDTSTATPRPAPSAGKQNKGNPFVGIGDRIEEQRKQLGDAEANRRIDRNVQAHLSWVALAMLPLFALLLRLFYWRKDSFYFVHLIYSLHYHSFLLIFWTVSILLAGLASWTHLEFLRVAVTLVFLIPPWYLFVSLRRLFPDTRINTGAKVFFVGGIHFLLLSLALAVVTGFALYTI